MLDNCPSSARSVPGCLSLAPQLTALCLGTEEAERYVLVRAANATTAPSLALLSAAFAL